MNLNEWRDRCHKLAVSKGFWDASDNVAVKLMLVTTELAEACESDRHGDRDGFCEEVIDAFIRLFDLAGGYDIDIESEIERKMLINEGRPKLHGKRY